MLVNKIPLLVKIIATLIGSITALCFPALLYYIAGLKNSLSLYVSDPNTAYIFNYSLIIIGLSLLIRRAYVLPSITLWIVVYFDVIQYPQFHNLVAGIFFILLIFNIIRSRNYIYIIIMFLNLIILYYFGLYVFELIAIFITTLYNLELTFMVAKREWN